MLYLSNISRVLASTVLCVSLLIPCIISAGEPPETETSGTAPFEVRYLEPAVPVDINMADLPKVNEAVNGWWHQEGSSSISRWKPPLSLPPGAEFRRAESTPGPNTIWDGPHFDSIDTETAGLLYGAADASLAVGPDHIVAVVNRAYEIYDKWGNYLAGPVSLYTFWYDVPNCEYMNIENSKVLYDEEHDRFVMTANGSNKSLCVACSHNENPVGIWRRYGYHMTVGDQTFEFPQAGIGRDALYVGANIFTPSAFVESRVYALDKSELYVGIPTGAVQVGLTSTYQTPQPLNLHGFQQHTWPTEGPHYFLAGHYPFYNAKDYTLFSFADPFGSPAVAPVATFDLNAVSGITTAWPSDAPQSGGGAALRAGHPYPLDFEYRNGYGWSTMSVGCLTSPATINNCIQWVQIDLAAGAIGPEGAGVYGIEDHWFLYPDLAANHCNDMMVGYTRTGASMHPAIWYTGREEGDPLGTLQAESQRKAGEAVYNSSYWGRYTGMTIDPNGTKFWYMGQYSKLLVADPNWGTYIGSWEFDWCQTTWFEGRKWHDVNGDGLEDPGEPGLNGWTIQVWLDDGDGVFDGDDILVDSQVTSTIGGIDGSYETIDFARGTYHIVEVPQPGWFVTQPPSGVQTEVLDGSGWGTGVHFGNFEMASLSGTKFEDVNGDGARDTGEPGLPGWIIYVDSNGDGMPNQTAVTGLDGSYSFGDLYPGTHFIWEEQQAGWVQTTANPDPVNVTTSGAVFTGIDFGNFQLGTISGLKFHDLDCDEILTPGEPGLVGWIFHLDEDGDGSPDQSVATDINGIYTFTGLSQGTYTVTEQAQAGWVQTTPDPLPIVITVDGTDVTGVNFGNCEMAGISGTKFEDMNHNGILDPGESGLPDWTIHLDADGDGVPDRVETTAADGTYRFSGLDLGTYFVTEQPQAGWVQTTPNPPPIVITVAGTAVTGVDFGNFQLGSISGLKFHDLSCEGHQGPGEPGLAGWIFHLDRDGVPDQSVATDINGVYTFVGLSPGTYTVTEQVQGGWWQSTPDPASIPVTTSGTVVTGIDFGNCEVATISGTKFEDLNDNGAWDPGEPGLPGWTIHLDGDGDGVPDRSETTAADGSYRFSGVDQGTYVVTEQLQAGWMQTTVNPPSITITFPGTTVTGVDFGNFRLGRIFGAKFEDLDHSGTREPGEPGIPGWVIFLDGNGDGVPDMQTATDLNGDYQFLNLSPHNYAVTEELQFGWIQTTPDPTPVSINASGDNLAGGDFGNFRMGVIGGAKFDDRNADGIWGPGEPGLSGWTITLHEDGDGLPDRNTVTDGDGQYSFGDLLPGSYVITELFQTGWIQTTADPAPVAITTSETVVIGVDFGNFRLGSISGMKFNDLNHDGIRDPGEPGLPGWSIDLDGNGDGVPDQTAITAPDGSYLFSGLAHGAYGVTEQVQPAWTQTTPDPAPIPILSGDMVTGVDFGNYFCEVTCTVEADVLQGSNPVTVQFTATAHVDPLCIATPVGWSWDFGDGVGLSTEQNPLYTYATPGNHTWTLTVTLNGVPCTATGTVLVNAYDMTFNDDHGRSHCCVNSTTGDWAWTAFDPRVGVFDTGRNSGMIQTQSGVMTIRSTPGMPWSMNIKYWLVYQRASGYFVYRAYRIKSPLTDQDTTNQPDVCDVP